MHIKNICIFAGSSKGNDKAYIEIAHNLGKVLVKKNITLIYGGANIGLMGVLADTVLNQGGKVIGVISEDIVKLEVAHSKITKLYITKTMYERKAKMIDMADAFIVLPGGLGTFDEMFEVFSLAQLGIHKKPCGILNINGYFDLLLNFIDKSIENNFTKKEFRSMFLISQTSEELIEKFSTYQAPTISKIIK